MIPTVQDILVNVDSGDLLLSAGDMKQHTFYEIVWGKLFEDDNDNVLYANVIIPSNKVRSLKADSQGRYLLYAKSSYQPYQKPFEIRLVQLNDGEYESVNQSICQYPVLSSVYFPDRNLLRVNASELPIINTNGNYLFDLHFGNGGNNTAYIYTADNTDFLVGGSDLQSSQLLSICEPGKFYRYPTTGIGTTKYIGSVVANTNLGDVIIEQFNNNGVSVQDADFNANTGELKVSFFKEEVEEVDGLLEIDSLNLDEADVTDAVLNQIAAEIDLSDYDIDYEHLIFDIDTPDASLESCFANGIWIGNYPWTGGELWKAHE